jgi:hypothetical protein
LPGSADARTKASKRAAVPALRPVSFRRGEVCIGSILLKKDFEGGLRAILIQEKHTTENIDSRTLRINKSEAGRLRIRAIEDGLLSPAGDADFDSRQHTVQ